MKQIVSFLCYKFKKFETPLIILDENNSLPYQCDCLCQKKIKVLILYEQLYFLLKSAQIYHICRDAVSSTWMYQFQYYLHKYGVEISLQESITKEAVELTTILSDNFNMDVVC